MQGSISPTTPGAAARRVGYGSSVARSAAFKRARGMSPQEYRRRPADRPVGGPAATVGDDPAVTVS